MKNVVIALNPSKDKEGKILTKVIEDLNTTFEDVKITIYNSYELKDIDISEEIELIIVLGGDGTLLGVARELNEKVKAPIFGVNIGNLGFLSSVEIDDLKEGLQKIKENKYTIEKRILLEDNDNNYKALNDIVIAKGTLSRIVNFNVYIDKKLYSSFKGDGLILATPTGSTAYSFSAGGPVIYPDVDVITITAICPHNRGMNTIVVNSNSEIEIEIKSNNNEVYMTFDGQKVTKKTDNSIIKVKKSNKYVKILLLDDYNYFDVLRKKILNNY